MMQLMIGMLIEIHSNICTLFTIEIFDVSKSSYFNNCVTIISENLHIAFRH